MGPKLCPGACCVKPAALKEDEGEVSTLAKEVTAMSEESCVNRKLCMQETHACRRPQDGLGEGFPLGLTGSSAGRTCGSVVERCDEWELHLQSEGSSQHRRGSQTRRGWDPEMDTDLTREREEGQPRARGKLWVLGHCF